MRIPTSLTDKVEPNRTARAVTALAFGAAGLLVVRRIPRPARRPAELLLAASSPWVASYLTQLGRAARNRTGSDGPSGTPAPAAEGPEPA